MQILLVVATEGEALFFGALGLEVAISGIGAVNAALTTLQVAGSSRPDLIINAGIAGAFPGQGLQIGDVALSNTITSASLGAEDRDGGFLNLQKLGFPLHGDLHNRLPAWEGATDLARRLGLKAGEMLTLETVTGTQQTLDKLQHLYPAALTEGMEGAGVALAGLRLEVPVLEVRGISNMVGPRDRESWNIPLALKACRSALERMMAEV
ncbi:futalosine hydrolase [Deinococcus cellulosilyticus]|uniref:Futalosine hydrolase n=1 Tax=Deinococcus cellulosilyticus (strain DSM 18568 / NBRC 106333 / KACC 11606 / 5516J-15) TaxID=1223518 RepID=A0A511N3M1_DEIC1|nr:futalosine hydrolase [Deinococcus cellulosilyticus]GEM47470.1 Futalosine hydrolase [Deinococcus cellulosilyticus NBRC 106333 = KACC 11606]